MLFRLSSPRLSLSSPPVVLPPKARSHRSLLFSTPNSFPPFTRNQMSVCLRMSGSLSVYRSLSFVGLSFSPLYLSQSLSLSLSKVIVLLLFFLLSLPFALSISPCSLVHCLFTLHSSEIGLVPIAQPVHHFPLPSIPVPSFPLSSSFIVA